MGACGRGSSINPSVRQISRNFDTQCTCLVALSGYSRLPLIDAGKVEAVVDRELPMSQALQAHRVMAGGEHIRKIFLLPT